MIEALRELQPNLDLVIWDFDGTVLDTETPAFDAAVREYEARGLEIDRSVWEKTLGSASHEPWWVSLRNRLGGDLGEPEEDVIARWRSYKNELTEAKDLRPGVRALFDELREAGIACAVASSSPQAWVEGHSRRFDLWDRFVAVATSDDVGAGRTKPHPDLFLLAAKGAGVAPERCLVIEDSHHGTVAAQRAGMVCLAAPNAMTASQDLSAAARIVGSLSELAD